MPWQDRIARQMSVLPILNAPPRTAAGVIAPRTASPFIHIGPDRVYDPLVLTPAELRNGASTWREKMDPKELARREAAASAT